MFSKIITGILAFLLMLFPSWGGAQYSYLMRTNAASIAAPKIVSAVEARDVVALESMMCKNIKDNVPDLPGEIRNLIDAIDGKITKSTWETAGGFTTNANGKRIAQILIGISFTTSVGTYFLGVTWEIANDFAKDEIGIRNAGLVLDGNLLYRISATEGIGESHS